MRWARRWLRALLVSLALLGMQAAGAGVLRIGEAQAARGHWDDAAPPSAGWTRVDIPDIWEQRWPGHDGVVWYRVEWQQAGGEPVGLLLHYMIMAGEVRLNGNLYLFGTR